MSRPATSSHTNRLATETSPYLLQHAHNPVDWYPWGEEALAKAREEAKPIFLSIGYAACHWCPVMERESFEDEQTAAQLNRDFVAVKVDREERPDLDAIYMDAVQAMTGQGGWPMSVFLTPEGRPFYGGTYFPGDRRYGMPSFRDVLTGVSRAWREERDEVERTGGQLAEAIARQAAAATEAAPAAAVLREPAALDAAVLALERSFDPVHGGWGGAPKFPASMTIEFLLRQHVSGGDARPLAMARRTLDAMADGGIHDQLGGGFARYATDAIWLVPHFEKMLYDNAQLARVYLHAWQVTGERSYREVVEDTLDHLLRDMRTTDGAFASSLDADSEGGEGASYLWTQREIEELLGSEAPLFCAAFDVTPEGNWEGHTILRRVRDDATLAAEHGGSESEIAERLSAARARLLERRQARPQPARDDKALAAWNGLAIAALAEAARVLGRDDYRAAAERAADFLTSALRDPDGTLRRSWKDGRASAMGVLEDHTHLVDGLLALYEASFDERWFVLARELMDRVLDRFADPNGGFFDTSDDHEQLFTRPKGLQDNALPSGNAMAATVLLRLAALTGEGRYRDAAETTLASAGGLALRSPTGFSQWLIALDLAARPIDELAVAGDLSLDGTSELLGVAAEAYRPHLVVAASADPALSVVPLLHERPMIDGRPTAYLCRGFACRQPVTSAGELRRQLEQAAG
jgi:uncharacterized protein YyaL (SSP411 family)